MIGASLSAAWRMVRAPRHLGVFVCTLLCMLLLALTAAVRAQDIGVIRNTATVEWDQPGGRAMKASNEVVVARTTAASMLSISAYRFDSGAGSSVLNIAAPRCAAGSEAALSQAWSDQPLTPASVLGTSQVRPGEPFLFTVTDSARNADPAAIDTLTLRVRAASGDEETLQVFETGANTGVFSGYLQTVGASATTALQDCRLRVTATDRILIEDVSTDGQRIYTSTSLDVLADPFGYVFDSFDGTVVSGARVTLIDVRTGQAAQVFGDDGVSAYPATVTSGGSVTDGGGTTYNFAPGLYRFPLVRPGTYQLRIEPPSPFTAPSKRMEAELAQLRSPAGSAYSILPASFGAPFALAGPEPVTISIPLDGPREPLRLGKSANLALAAPGDLIIYTVAVHNADARRPVTDVRITDTLPPALRLRSGSVRFDGQPVSATIDQDGRTFSVAVPSLAPGSNHELRYAAEVKPNALPGDAVNRVQARADGGLQSNVADAAVRIRRDDLSARMTIIGRITDGGCNTDPTTPGIPGVRVMLEDGSYAVTDRDGRYHFEGVAPGTHVVQVDDATLPPGLVIAECGGTTRSAGRSMSRFVSGSGGSLMRADFAASAGGASVRRSVATRSRAQVLSDSEAAGTARDWLAEAGSPGIAWLFPTVDHNPRSPLVRVVIKHLPGQVVVLKANGRRVDPVAFDGAQTNADKTIAISEWRGIPLDARTTRLTAEIDNPNGTVAETLTREVHFGASPLRAQLITSQSTLIADGVTRPVLAVRLTDRDGRPVRSGLTGEFELPAPYYPAVEADAQQARQLAGLERARPFWHVEGDDGLAYIELEPTTASGSVSLRFKFRDGTSTREQRVEAWLDPGNRPWTVVGLAEGSAGFNLLHDKAERLGRGKDDILTDGRLALYAKGRIRGKWLLTLAYDSDKDRENAQFGGTLDPQQYYTVFADRSERRYDASSVRKLYLRLERPQFYALFGDFATGIDEPRLTRYVRAFNGAKAEYRSERVAAMVFAADTPNRHQHFEVQGNGLSGPYALGRRDILANSEHISLEVRDRLRSDRVVDKKLLQRHIDYDIDYRAGTVVFREPILSRDLALNPQFIVADFEVDANADRSLNAGARATLTTADGKLRVGATGLRDGDETQTTSVAGLDVRYRPTAQTELRAEVAVSDRTAKVNTVAAEGATTAWLVEAEHHNSRVDLLAYAQERGTGFGVGQLSPANAASRKVGIDAAVRISEPLSVTASAWHEEYLDTGVRRFAARGLLEYRTNELSGRAGIVFADDRLADGRNARSTLLQLGATKRLFDNKLEIDGQSELALDQAQSIDFPARHRIAARYTLARDVRLAGSYEIADGHGLHSQTARLGFELEPWAGSRISLSGNAQDIDELGKRTFAAYGLSQTLVLDAHWTVDLTVDGNHTVGGIDPARVINPLHPVASGGYLGSGGLTEDFTALTAGATFRSGPWSATARAEYRQSERENRYGLTAAALHQVSEGSAIGAGLSWFASELANGAQANIAELQFSWAHRPSGSRWSWLNKLAARREDLSGSVDSPVASLISGAIGPGVSTRVVNSLSTNFTSQAGPGGQGWEATVFWGARYASAKIASDDVAGFTNLLGADVRFDIGRKIDVGLAANLRAGINFSSVAWSGGPTVGLTPFANGWLQIGWNVAGFRDRDFASDRYSQNGPYVTLRLKVDQLTLRGLGLGR